MNSLTLSFRNCGFASCLGLSFSENILQSLFSCVWNEELIPCTLLFLSAPNILHRTTAFQWLFVLRKKNIRSKVWFSRTAACMRRALLRVKEGDGCALSSLSLCLRNAHPSYCCSPLHLCNLSQQCCAELRGRRVFASISAAAQEMLSSSVDLVCNWQKGSS